VGKTALIFWGGWDGHEPEKVAKRFRRLLENEGFSVRVVQGAEKLPGFEELAALDLLVPVTTGCKMPGEV
jgi:type 1 glutamine amidotransferase